MAGALISAVLFGVNAILCLNCTAAYFNAFLFSPTRMLFSSERIELPVR
jgi:hypothetical protein